MKVFYEVLAVLVSCFWFLVKYFIAKSFLILFIMALAHCVKSVQIRSYFWSVSSCIRTEYERISPYSVEIQENMDQK